MASITKTRLHAGVWHGILTREGDAVPDVTVLHLGKELEGVTLTPTSGQEFALSVPIPSGLLCDGTHSFVVQNRADQKTLCSFSIIAGSPLEMDLRAEIDLLRAELDLLKRAFRRHCVETAN